MSPLIKISAAGPIKSLPIIGSLHPKVSPVDNLPAKIRPAQRQLPAGGDFSGGGQSYNGPPAQRHTAAVGRTSQQQHPPSTRPRRRRRRRRIYL